MTLLSHWWTSLSWSAATAIAMPAFSIGICLWIIAINWLRSTLGGNRRAIPPRRHSDLPFTDYTAQRKEKPAPWPQVDYSAKRQEKLDWLGADGLMARPVQRISGGSHRVGKVIRFERREA